MRTMPGDGGSAEGVSVIGDDAIASSPAEQTAAGVPQAGVAVAGGRDSAAYQSTSVAAISNPLAEALRDRYALERVLGRGGMATVYLARDLKHDRLVALKVLDPDVAASLGVERFQREIRVAARLSHPHVLSVYDSGEAAGRLWFSMPFVRGETLRERLRSSEEGRVGKGWRAGSTA